jgi:uncharacterized protein YwqG
MYNLSTLQSLVEKYVLSEYQFIFLENIKTGIQFVPTPWIKPEIGCTKFGGIPDTPADFDWPRHTDTVPYLFLMQINLAEAQRVLPGNPLPKEGLLSFFACNISTDAKVFHFSDLEALKLLEVPQFKQKRSIWHRIFSFAHLFKVFEACVMRPQIDYSIPTLDSIETAQKLLELSLDLNTPLLSESDDVDFLYPEAHEAKHHLFGHCHTVQCIAYELTLIEGARKKFEYPNLAEIEAAAEWILLFKINDDKDLNFTWMDAGSVLYYIRKSDLEKGDFSKVRVVYDTA